jgi:hypothetical protein
MPWLRFGWMTVSVAALIGACSSNGDDKPAGGTGGSSASGTGGTSATAGSGGSAGTGTLGGSGGTLGVGGSGGSSAAGSGGTSEPGGGAAGEDAGAPGAGGVQSCAETNEAAKLVPANLLFLIDKSGSMNCNPPEGDAAVNARCAEFPVQEDPNTPSKWDVASAALVSALDTLAGQSNVSAGLTLFPQSNTCGVSADPVVELAKLDASQKSAMSDELEGVSPSGETPIAGATILAYQHLADALRAGKLRGNTFVVLMTDGAETCKQSELPKLLATDVPHARDFDIRTFVIGAPGSESARSLLSQLAGEGGTPTSASSDHTDTTPDVGDCHFDMTTSQDFAKDLNAALQKISRNAVLTCDYDVPTNPNGGGVDRNKVNVSFKPGSGKTETIKLDDTASCDEANGWQYSEDGSKIVLCGEACDRVQGDPDGEVRIQLGCPTIRVVR